MRMNLYFFLAYDVGGAKYIWDVDLDFVNRNNMIMINIQSLTQKEIRIRLKYNVQYGQRVRNSKIHR